MSTTINIYPATDFMPLVEETRARTQELFQELLHRHDIGSSIEVKAFYVSPGDEPVRYVEAGVQWRKGLSVGFGYWVNGVWDSTTWPSYSEHDEGSVITEDDLEEEDENPDGSPYKFLGEWWIARELDGKVPPEQLGNILRRRHYWNEYLNMGGAAIASTGYGLVAAALAEATGGVVASFDQAFNEEHNGENAEQFLTWWGDRQISFYGRERFLAARPPA